MPDLDPTPTANLLALEASDGSCIDHYQPPAGIWRRIIESALKPLQAVFNRS